MPAADAPTPADIAALRPELIDGLAALALPEPLAEPLLDYLALLAKWNQAYNLTAIREPEQMVSTHLLDCLAALPELDEACRRIASGRAAGEPAARPRCSDDPGGRVVVTPGPRLRRDGGTARRSRRRGAARCR